MRSKLGSAVVAPAPLPLLKKFPPSKLLRPCPMPPRMLFQFKFWPPGFPGTFGGTL